MVVSACFISCVSSRHIVHADHTDNNADKARTLIENYISVIGGRENIEQIRSLYMSNRGCVAGIICIDSWEYESLFRDSAQLYKSIGAGHFLGKQIYAILPTDSLEHIYTFFKRTKKGVPYLIDYRQHTRPLQHWPIQDTKRAAYKLYSTAVLPFRDTNLVTIFYPSKDYDLDYYGYEKKKHTMTSYGVQIKKSLMNLPYITLIARHIF